MEPINLPPLGQIQLRHPKSFAAVYDLTNAFYNEYRHPHKLGRIVCAAVGMCWSDENEGKGPPRYNLAECDPIAYGGVVMDWLANKGVHANLVFDLGAAFITEVEKKLPSGEEVEAEKDFIEVGAGG